MESENNYKIEQIVGKDGQKKVVLALEDYEELLGIVDRYNELLEFVEKMVHDEDCLDEDCEGCSETDEDACCDGDEECCGSDESCEDECEDEK